MHIPCPAVGSYPLRAGNLVRPLVDGVAAFRRIGEAIAGARHSVWLTVAFYAPDFRMPDGAAPLFDVLDEAAARGLDVRVIFWRPNPESSGLGRTFSGSPADLALLRRRGSRWRARWDRGHGPYLQHQKSWLIDAGKPSEAAFVGGINLTAQAIGAPGHAEGHRHDVYVELAGPAAADVHHNFAQRWNEASERHAEDGRWGHAPDDQLEFPSHLPTERGSSVVQIQRNVHPGRYTDGRPSLGGRGYDIADGERTILDQYLLAITAARDAVYIENQAIPLPPIAAALEAALRRGVDVALLVPTQPEEPTRAARRNPERRPLFEALERLDRWENFVLAGIAAPDVQGRRRDIYVHSKVMLVDDAWATIGSCNLHSTSLSGSTEMNASIWDAAVARRLRCALFAEHLGVDTAPLGVRAALRLYRAIAQENRHRRDIGDSAWLGMAYQLDAATYGE